MERDRRDRRSGRTSGDVDGRPRENGIRHDPIPDLRGHLPPSQRDKGKSRAPSTTPAHPPPPPVQPPAPTAPMSMAARLRQLREKKGRPHVPEALLLRDVVYILQGIDGAYVRFKPPSSPEPQGGVGPEIEGYERPGEAEEPVTFFDGGVDFFPPEGYILSESTKDLLLQLAEIGHCYRQVALACSDATLARPGLAALDDHRSKKGKAVVRRRGVVEQSLIWALKREMGEYYRTVAIVEGRVARAPLADSDDHPSQGPVDLSDDPLDPRSPLTLKRLWLYLLPAALRLRMSATLANSALLANVDAPEGREIKGGALLSLLYGYTNHGDPVVVDYMKTLLDEVSRPLLGVVATSHSPESVPTIGLNLRKGVLASAASAVTAASTTSSGGNGIGIMGKWIREGRLEDPEEEFFVVLNPSLRADGPPGSLRGRKSSAGPANKGRGVLGDDDEADERKVEGHQLWAEKFGFRKEMLPSFISESFGRKIFSTGKSLNFIKYSCSEADWAATQQDLSAALPSIVSTGDQSKPSTAFDLANLERSISLAYSLASTRLLTLFLTRFHLSDHLRALKSYLLLAKGDFVSLLLEQLGPSLSKPAHTLHRHSLTATLETALQGSSSAADHPDILRRLDARMLEFAHGETGWDVFALEYKVEAPLDTVLGPSTMEGYAKIFRWLFGIKRVEHALEEAWRSLLPGARTVLIKPISVGKAKTKAPDGSTQGLDYDLHQARIVLAEMIHFVRQLQAYCHLEVIDCAWQDLEKKMATAVGAAVEGAEADDVVPQRRGESEDQMDLDGLIEAHDAYLERLLAKTLLTRKGGREDTLTKIVRQTLRIILDFREAVDSLYNYALSESARLEAVKPIRGVGATSRPETPVAIQPPNPAVIDDIRRRLGKYSQAYHDYVVDIISGLGSQSDMDMRFLGVRLNFSNKYKIERKKASSEKEKGGREKE